MGEVVSIVYRPQGAEPAADGYVRVPLEEARLVAGHGIEGDAKGGGPTRHLNILSADTLQGLAQDGFRVGPGQIGEKLTVAGVGVDTLPPGTRLRIGEGACVEVAEPRTGCAKFERHQGQAREWARGRLGVMARVVEGGVIRVGDPVQVVEDSAA